MQLKALLLVAGTLIAPLATAGAQRTTTATPGTLPLVRGARLRVKSSVLVTPLVANYLEVRGDTLVLFEEGAGRGIWSFAFDQIQHLEASIGDHAMYRPYIVKGALLGGAIGVVGGAVFAATFSPSDPTRKYDRLLTSAIGGVIGAGIGGIVGSRRVAEQFTAIPLPRRMSLFPDGRGARLVVGF